jgi:predicted DsbA family dithiol-disulfide isomerase
MKKLRVDIWSDVVCPWCAIGKRRFEAALARFAHKDEVEVVWRAFELDPSAPAVQPGDNATRLARKYGRTREQAVAMMQQVAETAARDGLDFDLVNARSGNTFDAHRVLHLAAERGVQDAVKERFFRAYMGERQPIGDREVLVRLAAEAGLDAEEVRSTLATDSFAAEVREEEEVAHRLGIHGVPFFVMHGAIGVSGAQPAEVLLGALEQAWSRVATEDDQTAAEGAVCGPDGCA